MAGGYARQIDEIVDIHTETVRLTIELHVKWHRVTVVFKGLQFGNLIASRFALDAIERSSR